MVGPLRSKAVTGHMSPEEFRRHGHAVVDWIASYWETLDKRPVSPATAPGEVAAALAPAAPEHGEGMEPVLADLDQIIAPALTHWQHPGFFGYFPANTSGPSVLGDLVCAGLGVQGMLWATSPACTELETVMLDWLADLLDLPQAFRSSSTGGGVIQDSASSAALVATLCGLHRASGGQWRQDGVTTRYTVYTSTQGHSSIEKAARIAGLGDGSVRGIEVDPVTLAMRPEALHDAIMADLAAGFRPALVVATVGTTSTTAIDPLAAIGAITRKHDIWLHVDAAYAGAAAVCPELRWINDGVEFADSYCFDRIRLRRVLGLRPRAPRRRVDDPPGVPPQHGYRVRSRDRLSRLAGPARSPVPLAQIVVRASVVRRRWAHGPHPHLRRSRTGLRRHGRRG